MFLVWNFDLETGVAMMDEQHQQLIALINELEMAHQAGDDAKAMDNVLPRLADYAVFHFGMEEKLLASVASGTAYGHHHLAEHAKFSKLVHDMQADRREDQHLVVSSLTVFLQLWLEDHIMGTDKVLAAMILDRSGDAPATGSPVP